MVRGEVIDRKTYYQYEICNMYYETRDLAERHQKFCSEKHACNIQIIKHAVKVK